MKPSEFRIGNYCQTDKGYLLIVNGLTNDSIDFHLEDRSKYPIQGTWQAEPIPITEEWLLRFGFEKVNHIHDGEIWCHKLVKMTWYPNGMINLRGSVGWNKVHYLHQLQNLYFALTGEELKLNEK